MAARSHVVVVPVSLFSWSTKNVVLGWVPRDIRRWAPSSGCRWQCPASHSLLAAILSLSLGSFPYNVSFVIRSLQWTLKTFRSILVYVPSRDVSIALVSFHASHPYSRMDSTGNKELSS